MSAFKYFTPKITRLPCGSFCLLYILLFLLLHPFGDKFIMGLIIYSPVSGTFVPSGLQTYPSFSTKSVYYTPRFFLDGRRMPLHHKFSLSFGLSGYPNRLLSVPEPVLTTRPALFCGDLLRRTADSFSFLLMLLALEEGTHFAYPLFFPLVPQGGCLPDLSFLPIFTHLSLNHLRKSSFVISFINIRTFLTSATRANLYLVRLIICILFSHFCIPWRTAVRAPSTIGQLAPFLSCDGI